MKWSETAWQEALPVYERILRLPFVLSLADGTLVREKFMHYLSQDVLYLESYSAVLSHIASRLNDRDHVSAFLSFASDGIAVERALHESFLDYDVRSSLEMSPACLLYTSVLKSQAYGPVETEAAAVLPCFWIYQNVGDYIVSRCNDIVANPYGRWISTYSDPVFAEAAERAVGICDELAEAATDAVRRQMTDIFVLCTKMEWLFWDSAWNLEEWKI